jgi:anaerobic selenocysteine-containing dehydrogenase
MTRTRHVPSFQRLEPEPVVELNRADALTRAIQDGDFVELTTRRGKVIAQARVTDEVRAGTCFVPFHWGRRAGFYKAANNLTLKSWDPVSRQPELKHSAAEVRRLDLDSP